MNLPRRRGWWIAVGATIGLLFLVKSGFWISAGCPLGFTLGSCYFKGTVGPAITGSTDHLIDSVQMLANDTASTLNLGGTQVVVQGNTATIDQVTRVDIPGDCKQLDFAIRGDKLRVVADGRELASITGR